MHVVMHTETETHAYAFGNIQHTDTCSARSNACTDGETGFHKALQNPHINNNIYVVLV